MGRWTRRQWLSVGGLAALAGSGLANRTRAGEGESGASDRRTDAPGPFTFCLNTSTIRGQDLGVEGQVRVASEAGYDGIEPWIRDLDRFVDQGGSLRDLGRRIQDAGLSVPSAIGFFDWAVDDDARRAEGLEEARRNMAMLAEIGGLRIAAPPSGMTDRTDADLLRLADRYRALLEVGEAIGVVPQVEVWGFSKTLGRLGEAALVAIESHRPDACILPDVYHLYKGGSDFQGLGLLSGDAIHVFHLNDYPANPPRASISDADRVFPGDGIAPLDEILGTLHRIGFRGTLSLELFNRDYWKRDAIEVARTGLQTMRDAVNSALR